MKNKLIIFPFTIGIILLACKHKKLVNYNTADTVNNKSQQEVTLPRFS